MSGRSTSLLDAGGARVMVSGGFRWVGLPGGGWLRLVGRGFRVGLGVLGCIIREPPFSLENTDRKGSEEFK